MMVQGFSSSLLSSSQSSVLVSQGMWSKLLMNWSSEKGASPVFLRVMVWEGGASFPITTSPKSIRVLEGVKEAEVMPCPERGTERV